MTKDVIMFLIIIGIIVFGWVYFTNDGKFTGFTTSNKYNDFQILGDFYDAGKGDIFTSEFDVFVDGYSKGRFSSALEVCQTLYPSSEKVWETGVIGEKELFTSRNGKKKTMDSYVNHCYG
mgnify:CR=1 FL=1